MEPTLRAQCHVDALAARCAADPDRPRRHFLPPARWMNDPNGTIRHRGWFHLFYQHNPYGDSWGHMHWGHARSRDLVTWEHLPIALAPEVEAGEEHCFSGCIAAGPDGEPRLLYTSVAFPGMRPFQQRVARPLDPDLLAWERVPGPVMAPHGPEARDPYVFAWQGRTFAVLGDGPAVRLYRSADGDPGRWKACGELWRDATGLVAFAECPNLLPLGDEHLLLISPIRAAQPGGTPAVEWRLGRFDGRTLAVRRNGRIDQHDAFYATNTWIDDAGGTVLTGWIRGFRGGQGWSGCLAFPRLVEADPVAGIRQRPHPAVDGLRQGPPLRCAGGAGIHDLGDAGDAVDCTAVLRGPASLRLAGTEIGWDGRFLLVGGGAYELAVDELRLRVLVDRSVVEVFADDGRCVVTRVVHVAQRDTRVLLRCAGAAEVAVHRLG